MRPPAAHRAAALVLALAAIACGPSEPPAVAVRASTLETEDLAVIKALFDDYLRPEGLKALRKIGAAPHFLVVDRTMAMCRRNPGVLGPQPGRCLTPDHANILSEVVSADAFPMVKLRFPSWNAAPMSIAGQLGADVTLVSPTFLDMTSLSELVRRDAGSTFVMLSAPGYPAPRVAVITVGGLSGPGAAARLERQTNGRWRVVATAFQPQD